MSRHCRRCKAQGIQHGVHFDITNAATGMAVMTYDICQDCMTRHSTLILPPPVPGTRVSYGVKYESFGSREGGEAAPC